MPKVPQTFYAAAISSLLVSSPLVSSLAFAEPIPEWELDDLWTTLIDGCLREEPEWTRQDCADEASCYIEGIEMTFDNDYAGYRQFVYEVETDTLTPENDDNMMFIESYCLFGF